MLLWLLCYDHLTTMSLFQQVFRTNMYAHILLLFSNLFCLPNPPFESPSSLNSKILVFFTFKGDLSILTLGGRVDPIHEFKEKKLFLINSAMMIWVSGLYPSIFGINNCVSGRGGTLVYLISHDTLLNWTFIFNHVTLWRTLFLHLEPSLYQLHLVYRFHLHMNILTSCRLQFSSTEEQYSFSLYLGDTDWRTVYNGSQSCFFFFITEALFSYLIFSTRKE